MDNQFNINNTTAGTLGGTLLALCFHIDLAGIINTALHATVAAAVSYGCSVLIRHISSRCRQK